MRVICTEAPAKAEGFPGHFQVGKSYKIQSEMINTDDPFLRLTVQKCVKEPNGRKMLYTNNAMLKGSKLVYCVPLMSGSFFFEELN